MGEGWTSSDERRTGPEVDDPPWRPQMLIYKQTKWFDETMKEHSKTGYKKPGFILWL